MVDKYLNYTGLQRLVSKIKSYADSKDYVELSIVYDIVQYEEEGFRLNYTFDQIKEFVKNKRSFVISQGITDGEYYFDAEYTPCIVHVGSSRGEIEYNSVNIFFTDNINNYSFICLYFSALDTTDYPFCSYESFYNSTGTISLQEIPHVINIGDFRAFNNASAGTTKYQNTNDLIYNDLINAGVGNSSSRIVCIFKTYDYESVYDSELQDYTYITTNNVIPCQLSLIQIDDNGTGTETYPYKLRFYCQYIDRQGNNVMYDVLMTAQDEYSSFSCTVNTNDPGTDIGTGYYRKSIVPRQDNIQSMINTAIANITDYDSEEF